MTAHRNSGPRKGSGSYPPDWKDIARRVKDEAGWRCVRCGTKHGPPPHVLTVHHLSPAKDDCAWWNLAALCQRCHLHIQHKVVMERIWYGEHSAWFRPYVAGWTAYNLLGIEVDRDTATRYADLLIGLHQGTLTAEDVRRVMRYEGVAA